MNNSLLKISGAGNRFLLVDHRWFGASPPAEWEEHSYKTKINFEDFLKLSAMPLAQRKHFIEKLISEKNLSLTDGLVILKQKKNLSCDFYNKDGSTAEVCGNAACCISVYAESIGHPVSLFQMRKEEIKTVKNSKGQWGISLTTAPSVKGAFLFDFQGQAQTYTLISSGVPHGVIECPIEKKFFSKIKTEFKFLAQSLRFQNPQDDKGMNVSFFQVEQPDRLKAITYERGVEDFTLACGTGALAVAFVYLQKHQLNIKALAVQMPGGELEVQIKPQLALFSPIKKGYDL